MSQVVYSHDALKEIVPRAFKRVEGKVKTVIDAALADPTQRKAAKSLVEQHIWTEFDTLMSVLVGAAQPIGEQKS